MAFSGGTFSRLYSWASDQSNGIKIRADRMDDEFNGMATGLSTCLLKDGSQTASARIPFAAGIKMGGQSIQLDPANSSAITAGTNNIIIVSAGGADQVKFTDGTIEPATDNDIDLGTASKEFKNAFFDGTVTTDGLTIGSSTTVTSVDADMAGGVSGSDDTLASAKTIKAYVDAQVDTVDTLAEVLAIGNTTTTDQKIQFRDAGIFINSSADGQLDVVADTEIQIAATTIDINGAVALSGAVTGATNITLSGELDAGGVATAATFEPDGDTAAGDNAAIGYTAAEGLILTGQGSTNDVTIKNDADADVIEIPTGTVNVTMAGTLGVTGLITASAGVAATGNVTATGTVEPAGDTATGDNAAIGYTAAEGLILTGQGSTNDVTIKNDADADVIEIPTGTTNVTVAGQLNGGTIILAETDTDTSNTGSVTIDFSAHQNFVLTLTGNVTLANPSTESVGQAGVFVFIQDGTGSRTLSLGTDYESPASGGITLSTAAAAVDVVPYFVKASGSIQLGAPQLAFG